MERQIFDPDGVGVDNGAYFGLPFAPDTARLVLLSVPWDVTVSYGAGAVGAPEAILEASTQLDFYDLLSPDAWRRGIATVAADASLAELSQRLRGEAVGVIEYLEKGGCPDDEETLRRIQRVDEGCATMNARVAAQAAHWLDRGHVVGLVGGDHSTPYGLIGELGRRHERFGILHLDAHCDLRKAYEGFEFSHASIMYNVLRDVRQVERIVQVGVRDFSAGELVTARESGRVELFDGLTLAAAKFRGETWEAQCRRIVEKLPHEVYVSFDIDSLSPDHCPHTGTPVPGGLSFDEALWLVDAVVRSGRRIIGFDVVEVVPTPGERIDAIVGARVLWKMCGLTLKSEPIKK